ncbi:MAG: iron ABC transporter permease [Elusimicrobia bacterium]|nr:iron ABC transporter permease [Elusimicrobiota bacterium]
MQSTGNKTFFIALAAAGISAVSVFFGATGFPSKEILLTLRLPRVLAGMITGAGLGACGAVMQGVLRNPLADPYILGTSSGAGLGVALALMFGHGYGSVLFYAAPVGGAFFATALSYFLAKTKNRAPVLNLLLSGVIVSAFLSSIILLIFMLKQDETFRTLTFMMGSISEADKNVLLVSSGMLFLGIAICIFCARELDIMSLGEEKALSLGVSAERIKILAFLGSSLACCAAVLCSGTVGFIGLIAPHIARKICGPSHKTLIMTSAFTGIAIAVLTDAVARTAFAPKELPVGVITAMLGGPFFLWILKRQKYD